MFCLPLSLKLLLCCSRLFSFNRDFCETACGTSPEVAEVEEKIIDIHAAMEEVERVKCGVFVAG